jgi:hypothetical protein
MQNRQEAGSSAGQRSSRPTIVLLALAGAVCGVAAQQTPTFRAGVDLIAVDVQVVASSGLPIGGLGPEKFQVAINGRPRKVVSAELLRYDTLAPSGPEPAPVLAHGRDAARVMG